MVNPSSIMDTLDKVCCEIKEKALTSDPLEKVLTNQLERWINREEEAIKNCLEDLNLAK